ncbi:MAG: metalloprotease [Candidatus Thorarchaeota archaeon]|jgi:proteasome lid subunit RPN8/RPN11
MEINIESETLEFVLHACKNTHPHEFAGFLREKNNVINEVLLAPGTLFGKSGSVVNRWMLPLDSSIKGSIHSHPSSIVIPSPSDLRFFSIFGAYHAIVGFPYSSDSIHFFDRQGRSLQHRVISW